MQRRWSLIATAAIATLSLTTAVAPLAHAQPAHAANLHPAAAKPAAKSAHPLPTKQAFYHYAGKKSLRSYAPGTVLNTRAVSVSLGTSATPLPAEQLLYRTRTETGKADATVTTIIAGQSASVAPRLVAYLSFYDALGPECDPSYTLTGGNAGSSANESQAEEEEAIISSYVTQGFTVEIPDFEGEQLHWAAGQESGYSTLDSLRASESYLKLPATTPTALTGYSGGSIAAEWASELQPKYAPKVHLIGVAEGGIPVDFAHNLPYINGSQDWSGVIPAVLVAESRAFHINLDKYASKKGRKLAHQVQHECIGSFNGAYPGLKSQSLLKPAYKNLLAVPRFVKIFNHLTMGTTPGHPDEPLFMAVGDSDGTGDGVMVTKDVEGLAHEYCKQSVPLKFTVYQGSTHVQAAIHFEPAALKFLQERFDGVPFSSGCASVGKGNSLKPLPMHKQSHKKNSHKH